MKDTMKRFWYNLLQRLDSKINQWLNKGKHGDRALNADDDTVVNFFVMVLKKVLNHVFMQCDFELTTDSKVAEPLVELCEDLQKSCYKIGSYMLGGSDTPQRISECWVVPYFETVNGERKLFHSYLSGDRICITGMAGNRITECYMIIDAVRRNDKAYFLCRRHSLDERGTLKITFFVADEQSREITASIPEWQSITQTETTYAGANNIGFGRYKSPVLAFGNDTYGKPLNYGCAVIEKQIQTVLEQIRVEFKSSGKKLFPDESIVRRRDKAGNPIGMWCLDEYIYPIQHKSGITQNMIDEFSPEIRESSYYAHLTKLLEQYQNLMGVNELITHEKSGSAATATEIRTLNIDNISLEDNIRKAVRDGNMETLKADSMYLCIREDLWTYDETWTDIYDDEQQRIDNNIKMRQEGAMEQIDLIKYWFPNLSDEEAQEKLERINAERQNGTQSSIESMLNM